MMKRRSSLLLRNRIIRLRRLVRGVSLDGAGKVSIFAFQRQAYVKATFIVRFLYIITLWPVLNRLGADWLPWRTVEALDPVWSVAWFPFLDPVLGADIIGGLTLVTILAVVLFPQSKFVRVLAFIGFFIFASFSNSFGKVNHDLHAWMAILFGFMFIPAGSWKAGERSILFRQYFLTAVWFGMALMMLFYSMAGLFKLYGIGFQISNGMVSALHPYGLAYQVMGRQILTNTESLFGSAMLDFPWIGWPMYLAAIYLEVFAIVAVFRPRLHLVWGLGLIGMHLGNWMFLSITFNPNVVLLALFFVNSPFRPFLFNLKTTVRDLPVLGWLINRAYSYFKALIGDNVAALRAG
jgi:hypothetical protein